MLSSLILKNLNHFWDILSRLQDSNPWPRTGGKRCPKECMRNNCPQTNVEWRKTERRRAESEWMSTSLRYNKGWSSYRLQDDWIEESWKWMNDYKVTVEWMKDEIHTGFQMTEWRRAESEWMSTSLRFNKGWSSYRLPDDWIEESCKWMNDY